jgi:F-type H+-transporting ATPase subunit epsilon
MSTFLLDVITPGRKAFSEEVSEVSVPTGHGTIGILPHHEPLFSALVEGEVKIQAKHRDYYLAIGGGFMEVTKTGVLILVSRAAHADELNESEIKKAQESARQVILHKAEGKELAEAQSMLRRSLLELKIYKRRRQRATGIPS